MFTNFIIYLLQSNVNKLENQKPAFDNLQRVGVKERFKGCISLSKKMYYA